MPRTIGDWEWDDDNLEHLAQHGLGRRVVLQVAGEDPRFRRNKRGRAASHQMIGPDHGGHFWTVCVVERSDKQGTWRAITGWPSEDPEKAWYRRNR